MACVHGNIIIVKIKIYLIPAPCLSNEVAGEEMQLEQELTSGTLPSAPSEQPSLSPAGPEQLWAHACIV